MLALADEHRDIVQAVEIGRTINDVPILALRVTRDAREATNPPGSKPAVLYNAAQHAREWITPEMIRRLAHLLRRQLRRHRAPPRAPRATRSPASTPRS